MALPTNVATGDPDHAGVHNTERAAINANETAINTHNHTYAQLSGAAPFLVNEYSTLSAARLNAAVNYWKPTGGVSTSVLPSNAIPGDLVFIPAS